MAEDRDDTELPNPEAEEWTSEEHTQLMTRYERIAAESAVAPSLDGQSVVAEFNLGGAVPRIEETRGRYKSKDIYVRLENTIYGPVTQQELGQMLASGQLTGFESASADLQHWTPLIYHPRMALSGDIDPDATHDLLHQASTLPAASRAPSSVDLEALADLADDEDIPGTPLAAILIKPIRVSRRTGLPLPVHADLESEPLAKVVERTEISEQQVAAGAQALSEITERAKELADAGELRLAQPPPLPPEAAVDGDEHGLELGEDPHDDAGIDWDDEAAPTGNDERIDELFGDDSSAPELNFALTGSEPAAEAPVAASSRSAVLGWVVAVLVVIAAIVAAYLIVQASTPPATGPVEQPAAPAAVEQPAAPAAVEQPAAPAAVEQPPAE